MTPGMHEKVRTLLDEARARVDALIEKFATHKSLALRHTALRGLRALGAGGTLPTNDVRAIDDVALDAADLKTGASARRRNYIAERIGCSEKYSAYFAILEQITDNLIAEGATP